MTISTIENILYQAMGLNAASIGTSAVMSAVEQRMSECNINDLEQYSFLVEKNKSEVQELIEEVVVAETWFFRDKRPFKMLTQFVKNEWLKTEKNRPIRILSIPCATGEEPYSIAITLIEAGLMPSQLRIDAFDISERNIKRCKTAHYRENSFRGVDPYIRERFFTLSDNYYFPDILIKAMVNFEFASVLDPVFANTQSPYDIVFCRNLLIYFDKKTQSTAADMLGKLLSPKGMLFVGHAETGIFSGTWNNSQRYPKSFIVRKFNDNPMVARQVKQKKIVDFVPEPYSKMSSPLTRTVRVRKNTQVRPFSTATIETKNTNISTQSTSNLRTAKQLADNGQLVESEKICIEYLKTNKQDLEVYFLLAVIQLANGDNQKSVQYFKNVIYLDPNNYDALIYLSTLLGNNGDEVGSIRYSERALRIKNRQALELGKV